MLLRLLVAFVAAPHLATPARADSWFAQMERAPGSQSHCVDVPLVFELSTQDSEFNGKVTTAGGDFVFKGPIGPGGDVSASFVFGKPGTATISGNAPTRNIRMTIAALRGCFYALKPVAEGPGAIAQWKATTQQTSGNVQQCQSGNRGSVTTIGDSLFVFEQSWIGPIFGVKTQKDGSADVDTMTAYGKSGRARVKVSAGSGPRLVQYVTYNQACGYKVIPD
jgi:hypothetical protein